jgi:hypothetical protein
MERRAPSFGTGRNARPGAAEHNATGLKSQRATLIFGRRLSAPSPNNESLTVRADHAAHRLLERYAPHARIHPRHRVAGDRLRQVDHPARHQSRPHLGDTRRHRAMGDRPERAVPRLPGAGVARNGRNGSKPANGTRWPNCGRSSPICDAARTTCGRSVTSGRRHMSASKPRTQPRNASCYPRPQRLRHRTQCREGRAERLIERPATGS